MADGRYSLPGSGPRVKLYTLLERTGFRQIAKWLYDVEVTGAERIPAGPAILVANHESLFDPWILALVTPSPVRYMAKSELWKYGLVGAAMESFGAFPSNAAPATPPPSRARPSFCVRAASSGSFRRARRSPFRNVPTTAARRASPSAPARR